MHAYNQIYNNFKNPLKNLGINTTISMVVSILGDHGVIVLDPVVVELEVKHVLLI